MAKVVQKLDKHMSNKDNKLIYEAYISEYNLVNTPEAEVPTTAPVFNIPLKLKRDLEDEQIDLMLDYEKHQKELDQESLSRLVKSGELLFTLTYATDIEYSEAYYQLDPTDTQSAQILADALRVSSSPSEEIEREILEGVYNVFMLFTQHGKYEIKFVDPEIITTIKHFLSDNNISPDSEPEYTGSRI